MQLRSKGWVQKGLTGGFRILGFRVYGLLGFRVQGSGFKGFLGFRVKGPSRFRQIASFVTHLLNQPVCLLPETPVG